jgi:hypothetical protein
MSIKSDLHALVDQLDEADAAEALAYIRDLLAEPGAKHNLFDPPPDDEPETEEERALVAEAKEALARGEVVPAADLYRRLGL